MSATTAGALKARLEGAGLGLSVFRDQAPEGQQLPYITVREAVANVPDRDGDLSDPTVTRRTAETVQIDLWQTWRNPTTGRVVEDYTLPGRLTLALHGSALPAAPTRTFAVLVQGSVRLLERDSNVVHHAFTAVVRRVL